MEGYINFNLCPCCGFRVQRDDNSFFYRDGNNIMPNEGLICPSCNFQPGYTDINLGYAFQAWRHKWVKEGMIWTSKYDKIPNNWNPREQLKNIGVIVDEGNNIVKDVEDPPWHWVPSSEEL